jgi:putative DNA primase/helicase
MMTAARMDASAIRGEARGKWREILRRFGVNLPPTGKQHGPCPACGGKDRFRFDDQESNGTWFCNRKCQV